LLQYQLFSIENGTSDMFVFKFNVGDQYLITRCKINFKKNMKQTWQRKEF